MGAVDGEVENADARGRQQACIRAVMAPQPEAGADQRNPAQTREGHLPCGREPAGVDGEPDQVRRRQHQRDRAAPAQEAGGKGCIRLFRG